MQRASGTKVVINFLVSWTRVLFKFHIHFYCSKKLIKRPNPKFPLYKKEIQNIIEF